MNKTGTMMGLFFVLFGSLSLYLWFITKDDPLALLGITFAATGLWVIYKSYRGKPTKDFFTPNPYKKGSYFYFEPKIAQLIPWKGPILPAKILYWILLSLILLFLGLILYRYWQAQY